jgi:glycosyltransferase involved in cell wall biosynthesis
MIVREAPVPSSHRSGRAARPVNVLMVTDHLGHANGVIHGASRYYMQVFPRFDRSRFNVQLCILGDWHPFADTLERAGTHPIFLKRSKWDPRALSDLLRLVRTMDIDLLHCLAMKGCLLGRLAGRFTGTPALIHLHDTTEPGALIGAMQRRIAPWTVKAVAVSHSVREFTVHRMGVSPERTTTLHNGLDVQAFASPAAGARERIRAELGLPESAFVILLAGRIVETKGQRLLIGLVPRLLEACPDVRLLVVGDGPDVPACRELARRLGIEQAVTFAGQRSDMPEILAAVDAAAMPSLQEEGFGYAALEAAAAGKPVAVFSGGALHEIIDDGITGFVVPRGDAEGLADALVRLAGDREVAAAMGRRGAFRAQRFGIDEHVRRLEALYGEIAGTRGAGGDR